MISLKENLDHILTKKIVKFIAKVKKKKKKGDRQSFSIFNNKI